MTLELTHPDTITYVLRRWERALARNTPLDLRSAGHDLAGVVKAFADAAPEPKREVETFTRMGLPRLAAARARRAGAKIGYTADAIVVNFPNGSSVTYDGAVWPKNGAAPGCTPPPGRTLEEILNAFADAEAGR